MLVYEFSKSYLLIQQDETEWPDNQELRHQDWWSATKDNRNMRQ